MQSTIAIKQVRNDPEQQLRETIGGNIALALEERNLRRNEEVTFGELADAVGATRSQMSTWVRGRTQPSKRYLDRIADELDRSYGWFMDLHAGPYEDDAA
jgi:transcriptional regulator with XRE-family HTH domain